MLKTAPNKVLANNIFRERVPWKSIVFNETNFEEFSLYTGISKEDAILSGVPFFDDYYRERQEAKNHIVYIEHPYLEEGILGWTEEHHQLIAESLCRFAKERQLKLYIKLHPRSKLERWEQYECDGKYVQIIQTGDFTDLYLEAKVILGFSSSLINGFICAKKNVVLLGWHPEPHIFGVDFSKSGLCHVSYSVEDLAEKYDHWVNHNLLDENEASYKVFLKRFNQPFDGKATQRVLQAITTYEIS
jgi:CDP-glycerol glycerophosphotransferase (TagB/SpsB family)